MVAMAATQGEYNKVITIKDMEDKGVKHSVLQISVPSSLTPVRPCLR